MAIDQTLVVAHHRSCYVGCGDETPMTIMPVLLYAEGVVDRADDIDNSLCGTTIEALVFDAPMTLPVLPCQLKLPVLRSGCEQARVGAARVPDAEVSRCEVSMLVSVPAFPYRVSPPPV